MVIGSSKDMTRAIYQGHFDTIIDADERAKEIIRKNYRKYDLCHIAMTKENPVIVVKGGDVMINEKTKQGSFGGIIIRSYNFWAFMKVKIASIGEGFEASFTRELLCAFIFAYIGMIEQGLFGGE